jgi:hypothetical protein
MAANTTYRIVAKPRFADLYTHTCRCCGHEELERPVWVEGPEGVQTYGTGCAAKLLYGDRTAVTAVRNAAAVVQFHADAVEADRAEKRVRYGQAHRDFLAGIRYTPGMQSCRQTYHRAGGSAALGTFLEFLARVAETGELPDRSG